MAETSPWSYEAVDCQGNTLSITIVFDEISFELVTVTFFRSLPCVYQYAYFGLGHDGIPDSAPQRFYVSPGTSVIAGAGVLAGMGLLTIMDVLAGQVTAGGN
jgi:hypothetical protein